MGKQKKSVGATWQIALSENAIKNIDEITGYIAFIKHEPLSAIRVGDRIFETIERIRLNPFAFQECEEMQTKTKIYRRAVCLSWLIIYKITLAEIVILGIVHTSRRPSFVKSLRKIK